MDPYFQLVENILRDIYLHYSRSPKNAEQLKAIMKYSELDILQPKSILRIRWVISKVAALEAVLQDHEGLLIDFAQRADDLSVSITIRRKADSLLREISTEQLYAQSIL